MFFFCFFWAILDHFKTKMFKSETTSFHYFHQFRITKNIGHLTMGSGGKKTLKRYLKSEHTDKQTDGQTYRQTDFSTHRKHRPRGIGPQGRCFEKLGNPTTNYRVIPFIITNVIKYNFSKYNGHYVREGFTKKNG